MGICDPWQLLFPIWAKFFNHKDHKGLHKDHKV
jgi:hypothetical protein